MANANKGGSRAPQAFFGKKVEEPVPEPKSSVIADLEEEDSEEDVEDDSEEETPDTSTDVLIKDGVIVTEPRAKTTPLIELEVKPVLPTPSFHTVNPDETPAPKVKAIIPRKTKMNLRVAGWNLVLEEGKRVEVPTVCLDHLRRCHFI